MTEEGRLVALPLFTAEELSVLRDALHTYSDMMPGSTKATGYLQRSAVVQSLQTAVAEALNEAER